MADRGMEKGFLESENRMVNQAITDRVLDALEGVKISKTHLKFCDFDGSVFILSNADNREVIRVGLSLNYWSQLEQDSGVTSYLNSRYQNTLAKISDSPLEGTNITLDVNINDLCNAPDYEKTIKEISLLKRNCFATAFQGHFQAHRNKQSKPSTVIPFRQEETMYIGAKSDHVTVIFSTIFKDPDDQVLAKIFLESFQDAKIGGRAGHNPPQVIYSPKPPMEISRLPNFLEGPNVYYLTFVLQPNHVQKEENTINLLHTFRTYLHYHIKCSKAYMHQRMRAKTNFFLQSLNRAKKEKETKVNQKYGH
jgi:actin related protein 2/3 complex subunit 2